MKKKAFAIVMTVMVLILGTIAVFALSGNNVDFIEPDADEVAMLNIDQVTKTWPKITSNAHSNDLEAMGVIFEWEGSQSGDCYLTLVDNGKWESEWGNVTILVKSSAKYAYVSIVEPGVYHIPKAFGIGNTHTINMMWCGHVSDDLYF